MVSSTICKWIKKVIRILGVNVGVFKGYLTRSASPSETALSVLSAYDTVEKGC